MGRGCCRCTERQRLWIDDDDPLASSYTPSTIRVPPHHIRQPSTHDAFVAEQRLWDAAHGLTSSSSAYPQHITSSISYNGGYHHQNHQNQSHYGAGDLHGSTGVFLISFHYSSILLHQSFVRSRCLLLWVFLVLSRGAPNPFLWLRRRFDDSLAQRIVTAAVIYSFRFVL